MIVFISKVKIFNNEDKLIANVEYSTDHDYSRSSYNYSSDNTICEKYKRLTDYTNNFNRKDLDEYPEVVNFLKKKRAQALRFKPDSETYSFLKLLAKTKAKDYFLNDLCEFKISYIGHENIKGDSSLYAIVEHLTIDLSKVICDCFSNKFDKRSSNKLKEMCIKQSIEEYVEKYIKKNMSFIENIKLERIIEEDEEYFRIKSLDGNEITDNIYLRCFSQSFDLHYLEGTNAISFRGEIKNDNLEDDNITFYDYNNLYKKHDTVYIIKNNTLSEEELYDKYSLEKCKQYGNIYIGFIKKKVIDWGIYEKRA